jgi:hypothetical protein
MNNKLAGALAFVAGAAIGSVVTWKLVKAKYKKIADEEIESVINEFRGKQQETTETSKEDISDESEEEDPSELRQQYTDIIGTCEYGKAFEGEKFTDIFVISPDDYVNCEYDTTGLTYYADKVLTYEDGKVVECPESIIGPCALNIFDEEGEDSVYVRNDKLEKVFEIMLDYRRYEDVVQKDSHLPDEDQVCETK